MKKLVPFLAVLLLYAIPAKANPLDVLPLAPLPVVETALFGGQSGTSGPFSTML